VSRYERLALCVSTKTPSYGQRNFKTNAGMRRGHGDPVLEPGRNASLPGSRRSGRETAADRLAGKVRDAALLGGCPCLQAVAQLLGNVEAKLG